MLNVVIFELMSCLQECVEIAHSASRKYCSSTGNFDWPLDFHDVEINVFIINYNNYIGMCVNYYKFSWIVICTCHIAGKFGGKKVWQI